MGNLRQCFLDYVRVHASLLKVGDKTGNGIAVQAFEVFSQTLTDVCPNQGLVAGKTQ